MTRLFPLLLLCCHNPDPRLTAIEAETARLREQIEERADRLAEAERQIVVLGRQVDDARSLCLIGGPRRRYVNGVRCSDDNFLPGSFGASAHRALIASGWCEEQVLPKAVPMLVSR